VPLDFLCGSAIGALNVCGLAAWADEPRGRAERLERYWLNLKLNDAVHVDALEALGLGLGLLGLPKPKGLRGGLLDPKALQDTVRAAPFYRIGENLKAGHVAGVSVSTTHVASGRTFVFIQRARPGALPRFRDPWVVAYEDEITAEHALASAAIPLLFPAVKLHGAFHVDGSLRQNTPILPARLLGADAMVVVNAQWMPPAGAVEGAPIDEQFPGPQFLIGKALDALLLDRIDADLDQTARMNALLAAGEKEFGAGFVGRLNHALGEDAAHALRPIDVVLVRASENIGHLAAEYVRSEAFRRRHRGLVELLMRRLAEGESRDEADFLSYLLFDGEFARQLMELGRKDAAKRHEELCRMFTEVARGT
jgi:NTE family protein